VSKFSISSSSTESEQVLDKLQFMNINAFSLFGNEEGLANSLAYSIIEGKEHPIPPRGTRRPESS
jgi:hypothetical protein